jgi:hypothetical protein
MEAPRRSRSAIALAAAVLVAAGAGLTVRRLFAARAARAAAAAAAAAATASSLAPASTDDVVLHVPHVPGGINLDGDTDDPGWTRPPGPARTGPFLLASGAPARPYSETRLVWGDGYLYLCLYAADEDVETRTKQHDGPLWLDDSFRVTFARSGAEYVVEVSPDAVVTDSIRRNGGAYDYSWESGVHVSKELDGTMNAPDDEDEEWVVEMAVPFESIGLKGERGESIGFSVRRCDTPKHAARVCASFGEGATRGRLVLD